MGNLFRHCQGSRIISQKSLQKVCLANPITNIWNSNSWENETCFIIGGGPSLKNFDWNLLKGYKVIGINKAFEIYPSDINYSLDYYFFDILQYGSVPNAREKLLRKNWRKFSGVKLFALQNTKYKFCSGIHYVKCWNRKGISFDLEKGIYVGNNSGTGALMLAIALGCKKIGLLGYDFKTEGDRTHWHDGYSYQDASTVQSNLDSYRENIEEWASPISEFGIKVFNLSSNSNLQTFPISDIQTFLRV